ncbi:MAG TPA: hypothetical protein VFT22_43510 [Kofleriaceae bacterium]|nr:hypothetical protein [Kofleriaceae bacterium]
MLSPRRHRWITVPSGALLFACLFLPGYRDCGINHAMSSEPPLIAVCVLGVAVALAALVLVRGRAERWVAIGCVVLSVLAAGLLALACAAVDEVYAGITVGLAAALSMAAGGLVWEREVRGRPDAAARYLRVLVPVVIAGTAIVAATSTWSPPPNRPPDVPIPVR